MQAPRSCPTCRTLIERSRGSTYCPQCGRALVVFDPLAHRCTSCGRVLEAHYRYCDGCGRSRYGEPGTPRREGLAAYARADVALWAKVGVLGLLLPVWLTSEIRQAPFGAWVKGVGVGTVWLLLAGVIAVTVVGDRGTPTDVPISAPGEVAGRIASTPEPTPTPAADADPEPPDHALRLAVTRVIDGDTLVISGLQLGREDGQFPGRQARLVGVDAPELYEQPECYGAEASDFVEEALQDTDVLVAFDVERVDDHGRALVYLWELDGTFFNGRLVSEGMARRLEIPPNVRYAEVFERLEAEARAEGAGMWGACPEATAAEPECHLSYPDGCIPPAPPELNCDDVVHRNFTVRHDVDDPDPHGFDPDGNGLGCEGSTRFAR